MSKFIDGLLTGLCIGGLASAMLASVAFKGPADIRQEAIDAGAAEWTIDAKTGEKSFKWVTTKPE